MVEIKSSDPHIHLENVKVEEQVLLKRLKEKEAELRILLSELRALRNIKEEAIKHIEEEEEYQREEEQLHEEQESVQSIDELVDDVKTARQEGTEQQATYQTNTSTQPLYNLPETNQVELASDSNTITELYNLAKKTEHTPEEKQRFFEITSAVIKSRPYEMNPVVQERVDTAYQALKTVIGQRPDLASEYKPAQGSKVNEFLEAVKKGPQVNYKL
ncbi:MAG: hypothetical protein KC535_01390 [Nanoarchaeota archaeon]|nr:hypothetical protein [Nanoarchaeota archaeon]